MRRGWGEQEKRRAEEKGQAGGREEGRIRVGVVKKKRRERGGLRGEERESVRKQRR